MKAAAKFKEIVAGMWGIVPFSKKDISFEKYYSELLAESNIRNPWFQDFYKEYFECFIGSNCSNVSVTADPDYQQSILVPLVMA